MSMLIKIYMDIKPYTSLITVLKVSIYVTGLAPWCTFSSYS